MKKLVFVLLLYIPLIGYAQTDCAKLSQSFNSYDQAIKEVKIAKFRITDYLNTSTSSFITGANYYSCDGITGFLIIGLNNRLYIHKGFPFKVWLSFKEAKSFGTFYNQNIRNKYELTIKP